MTTTSAEARRPRDGCRDGVAEYAATHDPQLRAELVEQYAGLCTTLASRLGRGADSFDDLRQQAAMGLLSALDRFDPDRGVEFTTFAWATISGELKRYLRDRCWRIRVPRSVQDTYLQARVAVDELRVELGREPTRSDVAARCVAEEPKVAEALGAESAQTPASLDVNHGPYAPQDLLGDSDPSFERVEDRQLVDELLENLAPRDREILRLHFLDGLNQTEIGRRIGISQVHVSRLIKRSLEQLRELTTPATPDSAGSAPQ